MTVTCPKCSYTRTSSDEAPEWQCPACGVAYNKVRAQPSEGGPQSTRLGTPEPAGIPGRPGLLLKISAGVLVIAVIVWAADAHLRAALLNHLGAANRPPSVIHVCWANCFTLTLKNGRYVRSDGLDETWTIERFTSSAAKLHRHDAPADWNGFSTDVTYEGQVSNDRLIGITIDGKPASYVTVVWGVALNTLPGSNAERDRRRAALPDTMAGAMAPMRPAPGNGNPPARLLSNALLETAADTANNEPRIMELSGKPSGVTVTMNGHGGACSYSGKGYYSVNADGELKAQVVEDCGGVTNMGSLVICVLTEALECGPTALFAHRYQLTVDGLALDSQRVAWVPTTSNTGDLLQALRARMSADQNLARAQSGAGNSGAPGSTPDVKCSQPKASFLVGGSMRLLSQMPQHPDLGKMSCIDGELKQFLAGAKPGDAVAPGSALGQCLQNAFPSTDWSVTRCEVVGP